MLSRNVRHRSCLVLAAALVAAAAGRSVAREADVALAPRSAELLSVEHLDGPAGGFLTVAQVATPSAPSVVENIPAPVATAPQPTVFRRVGLRRRMAAAYGCRPPACPPPCPPPITQRLTFCHPCTGCPVTVDVCIPGDCVGEPAVHSRCTLVGCGLVRYDWCCGYSVIFRFTQCGDVRVIHRG